MGNVLILCTDEHRRDCVGCYGHPHVKTPTMDWLAARGTRFTNGYTPSPICVPARASLATGLHVHEHGCWSSAEPYYGQHESWMHRVRDADKLPVSIGKLHFRGSGDDHGFVEERLPMYLANGGKGWTQGLLRGPIPPDYPEAAELAQDVGPGDSDYLQYDRAITRDACEWLKKAPASQDWVLFVSFVSPHFPLVSPPEFYEPYADVPIDDPVPAVYGDHAALKYARQFWNYDDYFDLESREKAIRAYYGMCAFMDHNKGEVLKALEQSGQLSDTTILSISDHGELLGDHGFWTKSVMYEASVGVPMIGVGPGFKQGVSTAPVTLCDVAGTVEHALGLETDRHDLFEPVRDQVISEYHDCGSSSGMTMLRRGRWKLVVYAAGEPDQLFDVVADPNEQYDLADKPDHQTILQALHQNLAAEVDINEANDRAFADQKAKIEEFGGVDAIGALPSFNHTPVNLSGS